MNAMNLDNKDGKELSVGVTVLYTRFDTYPVVLVSWIDG